MVKSYLMFGLTPSCWCLLNHRGHGLMLKTTFPWKKSMVEFHIMVKSKLDPIANEICHGTPVYPNEMVVFAIPSLCWLKIPHLQINRITPFPSFHGPKLGNHKFWRRTQISCVTIFVSVPKMLVVKFQVFISVWCLNHIDQCLMVKSAMLTHFSCLLGGGQWYTLW